MNGTFRINQGLKSARQLLLDINEIGLPAGCEFLDTISPQYIGDLVAWGAIGARTTESQVHRELASGLSVPVGFKNATDGNVVVSVDAIRAARIGHHFLSVTKQGLSAIVETSGNASCHVILRGGISGPNYDAESIRMAAKLLEKAELNTSLMIDCSHGNSQKNHLNQLKVAADIATQLKNNGSDSTAKNINGVMIESNLVGGRQNLTDDPTALVYGQSITDSCLSWDDTISLLDTLRGAIQERRKSS